MTSEQRPGATWIARDRHRVGLPFAAWFIASPFLLAAWPAELFREEHPPVGGFVYLGAVTVALFWTFYRAWYFGVRWDGHSVAVWNIARTYRVSWTEVESFIDGTTDGRNWALTVILRDRRGIIATATRARRGSPEILTAVRQAAARHRVPAQLTGVAAERPRAWLDAADEARRLRARFATWLAVAVISVAGIVLLIWLGRAHSRAHHVNYYPATIAGGLAVAGALAAWAAWRMRRQFRGRGPVPAQDRCGEGGWFAVPLPNSAGFAPGLIARTESRRDGLLLCYFFAPIGTAMPAPGQLSELRAADAVLVQRLAGLAPKWQRLGPAEGWDRAAWPVPAFGRSVNKTGQSFLDIYDDDLGFVGEELTDRAELDGLPRSGLLSPSGAEATLAHLLPKPSGTASAKPGPRILWDLSAGQRRIARNRGRRHEC